MKRHRPIHYFLFLFCLLLLGLFLLWPIFLTIGRAFWEPDSPGGGSFTLKHILYVFRDPVMVEGLRNSLMIAVLVTTLCLCMAMPLALLNRRYDFFGKSLVNGLVLVPLILPPFVGAIGLKQLLGRYGSLNSLLMEWGWVDPADPISLIGGGSLVGVVLMEALHLYPIVYLNITAALANLDPTMDEAAGNLGASKWQRFWRITFPLIRSGVFAGSTIVFIWSFTELGTPLMFDFTRVAPVQVFWGIQEMDTSTKPYALIVVMLAMAMLIYLTGKLAFGRKSFTATTRASIASTTQKVSGLQLVMVVTPFLLVTALAILPHLGVILTSFSEPGSWYRSALPQTWTLDHYTQAMTHPLASGSIRNSLIYSLGAMSLDIVVGFLIAYLIVRTKVFGIKILDTLSMLPLAVPGLVMAFGYVAMSIQISSWFTSAGHAPPNWLQVLGEEPNPILFLVIAYAVRRLPYVVRSAAAGLEQTPIELEEAAVVLGASRWLTIRKVVAPLIMANLIAGGLLAFSFAMLEVSDSLILAQSEEHYPITTAIYQLYERLGDGPYLASAMGVWGMLLLALTLIGASMLLGKKMGAIFRI